MYIWSKGVEHVWFLEEWCYIAPKAYSFPAWFATCQGKRSHDTRSQVGHWRHWAMGFFPKMSHLHSRWLCYTMLVFWLNLRTRTASANPNTFMIIQGCSWCQSLPKEIRNRLRDYESPIWGGVPFTPPKTTIAPKNGGFQVGISKLPGGFHFQVLC